MIQHVCRFRTRHSTRLLAILVLFLSASLVVTPYLPAQQTVPSPLIFENVTVVDVARGALIPEQRVVVVGNRIQAVSDAKAGAVPRGAQVVDARGKFLVPGFWDMHSHLGGMNGNDSLYRRDIANGVTGVRELLSTPAYLDPFRAWQNAVMAGESIGPRAIGPVLDLTYMTPPIEAPADAGPAFDSLKAAGIRYAKYHSDLGDPAVFFAILKEARRTGLPAFGHVPLEVSTVEAADSGYRSIEHVDEVRCWRLAGTAVEADPDSVGVVQRCTATAAAFVRNGTWFTPTLSLYAWFHTGEVKYRDGLNLIQILRRSGVTNFLTGTDLYLDWMLDDGFVPGFPILTEMVILTHGGLTTAEALQAATLNPAKFFGVTDSLGTVAAGKLADLVLLDADPLADIRNVMTIRAVVANGRYFDRAALEALDPEGAKRRTDFLNAGSNPPFHP